MLSPSKANMYTRCPVAALRNRHYPDTASPYAEEGRLAHALAEALLTGKPEPAGVPDDMRAPVQTYIDTVKAMSLGASVTRVEEPVDLTAVLDEGEKGTVDFFAVVGNELQVHDLKYGQGVEVNAEDNAQLILYGLGALPLANSVTDIEMVRLVIHQPRLGHVSEVVYTVAEMENYKARFRSVVEIINGLDEDDAGNPGPVQCRYCKAVKDCPDITKEVLAAIAMGGVSEGVSEKDAAAKFAVMDMGALAKSYAMLPLIRIFVNAVEEAASSRMFGGEAMPGFKLVEGRAGNRQWADDGEAEKWMKKLKLKVDEMYTKKVISPTAAEKLLGKNAPRKWEKLQPLVTRTPPKPTIVPESDKRPAMSMVATADDFDDLTKVQV